MASKYERRRRELKDPRTRPAAPAATARGKPGSAQGHSLKPSSGQRAGPGTVVVICGLLALGSALVFAQTAGHKFVNCDDNEYVYENRHIQQGLTPASAWWAVTQAHSANWHPLTWMSHTIDWQVFGRWDAQRRHYVESWPGGHHAVNVALHAAVAVLLFLVLQQMTGATWPSALAAALFAIHPLRAEPVAWVTSRKDMLSGLFFVTILGAYRAYAVRPFSWWRYLVVVVCFGLGLAAKSMLVTVPLVLLLLDFWPLRRIAPPPDDSAQTTSPGTRQPGEPARLFTARVVLEKIPLLALSAWSCYLTIWAQSLVAAFKPLEFHYRVGNAVISYAMYILQMFYPAEMVVHYPHPGPSLKVEATLWPSALLLVITVVVAWLGWRRRYLVVGWLWYLGMLVPVIGLMQVGAQARADRYTYLTQIGLYIMIAWGLSDLFRSWRGRAAVYAAIAVPVLAALSVVAWRQTSHWQDSLALWEHCVACQPETNDFAQNMYGVALADAGRVEEATKHYIKAVEINPKYLTPRTNIAVNLQKAGKFAEALTVCDEALEVEPNDFQAHFIKAVALYSLGKTDASIEEFRVAIERNSRNALAHNNLAEVLRMSNRHDDAMAECAAALELNPDLPEPHRTMGQILLAKGDLAGAVERFRVALRLKPADLLVYDGLADALWRQGSFEQAVEVRRQQVAMQPQSGPLVIRVVRGLISDPRPEARFGAAAVEIASFACEATQHQDIHAMDALAAAYAETGDFDRAEATIRAAMETPLGQKPDDNAKLRGRLMLYHARQKFPLPP